jgi:hypothetical protein
MNRQYQTYGAAFDGQDLVYFCYNENLTTIQEFLIVQDKAFQHAMQRQWRLFKQFNTPVTEILLRVSLN